ncbi:aspartate carbamoyltransferase [Saprolegnia diclina VS20]|uniref:aspartate carbamoyltransferase n=1 Tax=Saprolegnia diclina (strain VS20) TaxID=1156394 RepID=T0QMI3_SAPDV|nr:aspartate carbamoyltransferase [Saprolegnia diclina VS20]EQC35911.1 aspartate carbamoyltransferase [Saprolegnia diclina VS20]|eukprot:XP_008610673.1 aspartate carbamoyltransferase [Saprolegnia diclina VS20]
MEKLGTTIGSWSGKGVLSTEQLHAANVRYLFQVADHMKDMVARQGGDDTLKGKVMANVFFEPSTRTSCSFQAAMLRLGGAVVCVNESSSSSQKGETLSDTMRCLECYADVTVLRHPVKGAAATAAAASRKPVLNAGDGVGEHPTQALLDLYTIYKEAKLSEMNLTGKVITMVGDLKNGRTVHSLAKLLAHFNVTLNYVSPESLKMPRYIVDELNAVGVKQHETADLDSVLAASDVLYITRVQKERFETAAEYDAVKDSFIITPATLTKAKATMILMHPLPRVNEIAVEVDADPRAAYFRQMEYGMYVRMAILALVLGKA